MKTVGFVGAGNMAQALIRGILDSKKYRASEIWASDTNKKQLERLQRQLRVKPAADNSRLVAGSETIVLAVKPQVMDGVLAEIRPVVTDRQLFVSIAAGVRLSRLQALLGPKARIIRVMPNTPALVARGVTVAVAGRRATARDMSVCCGIFQCVGSVVAVRREQIMDAVTGLSGSGPAYVYLFAEALCQAGQAAGLGGRVASKLVYETIAGAAAMLLETGRSPAELRAMVSSPGGTTVAGLEAMERLGFTRAVKAAVVAATKRSKELSGS